jgi:hypothetical protein
MPSELLSRIAIYLLIKGSKGKLEGQSPHRVQQYDSGKLEFIRYP